MFRPSGEGPFPALVFMHGCSGLFTADGTVDSFMVSWAHRFRDKGYVTLLVDSFSPRGFGSLCALQGDDRPVKADRERVSDAYGGMLYLQDQRYVNPRSVGIIGWSNGGNTMLFVIASGAPSRPTRLPHGDFRAAVALYPGGCDQANRSNWTTQIPLLMLLGEKDDWTGAKPCVDLATRATESGAPIAVHVYPDAYHGFDRADAPLRVRSDVVLPPLLSRGEVVFPGGRSPKIGTNAKARADALERVPAFFETQFGTRP
jgi:dienelactone hydrolase